MEKELSIKLNKRYSVFGRLRGSLRQKRLIVFVHGLGGDMDGQIFYVASRYFEKKGWASYRFNLYGSRGKDRNYMDSTLSTSASDLDKVIQYFRRRGVKKIWVIGHSYGGPTILMSRSMDYQGMILWDPTIMTVAVAKMQGLRQIQLLNAYLMEPKRGKLVGKKLVNEAREINAKKSLDVSRFQGPLMIALAENSVLKNDGKKLYTQANKPKGLTVIPGARHGFTEDGALETLMSRSWQWIKQNQ